MVWHRHLGLSSRLSERVQSPSNPNLNVAPRPSVAATTSVHSRMGFDNLSLPSFTYGPMAFRMHSIQWTYFRLFPLGWPLLRLAGTRLRDYASWCCNPSGNFQRHPKLQTSFIAPATCRRDRTWAKSTFTKFPRFPDIRMATACAANIQKCLQISGWTIWSVPIFPSNRRDSKYFRSQRPFWFHPTETWFFNRNIHREASNKYCSWMPLKRMGKTKSPVPPATKS